MLWLIRIVGGLLIMMGQPDRSEACSTTSARKIRLLETPAAIHRKTHELCLCAGG